MSDDIPMQFSDEQARAILARAIEIDARAPMTTTEELRILAAEIGVSAAALEAAVQEQITSRQAQHSAAAQRTTTQLAGLGVSLGMATGWLLSSGEILTAAGLMAISFVAGTGLVIYQSATGTLREFHVRNLALWGGVAVGSLASLVLLGDGITRMPALMAAGWCIRSWMASSILGSAAVLAVRRSRRAEGADSDADSAGAAGPIGESRWVRVAKRVLGWTMRPLRFGGQRVPIAGR